MLSESEKRAVLLAVSRYGADSSRVFLVVQSVLEQRSQGDSVDLLELFQHERLLSASQVRELRFGLEKTLVDPLVKNGSAARGPSVPAGSLSETLLPNDATDQVEDEDEDTQIGLHVLGDYRILRQLGEGGTGTV